MDKITEELKEIQEHNQDGLLRPEEVVDYAQDPETALHNCFTWDDTEAARQYRLWQARQVIRVRVTYLPEAEAESRTFVSLTSDRKRDGGGYRPLADVMSTEELRERFIDDILSDLFRLKAKAGHYEELAEIFKEVDKVAEKQKKKKRKQKAV